MIRQEEVDSEIKSDKVSEEGEERKSTDGQDRESKREEASIGLRGRLDFDANVGNLVGSQKS